MTVPDDIRNNIRARLWEEADSLRWSILLDNERADHYERWTRDPAFGGRLARYMDPRKVRVYIKDSLIKPYERSRLEGLHEHVWRLLEFPDSGPPAKHYTKPHGQRLTDGKVACWGNSRDWKLILMAAFERAHEQPGYQAFGAVLVESGRTSDESRRRLVRDAGSNLGIQHLVWLD